MASSSFLWSETIPNFYPWTLDSKLSPSEFSENRVRERNAGGPGGMEKTFPPPQKDVGGQWREGGRELDGETATD